MRPRVVLHAACGGSRERGDSAGRYAVVGNGRLVAGPSRDAGRPAGQGPEVAQLLLAGCGMPRRERQSDPPPLSRPSHHPVADAVAAAGFGDFAEEMPRVTVPRATRGTPPLIRTTKAALGRQRGPECPADQCRQPELQEEHHWHSQARSRDSFAGTSVKLTRFAVMHLAEQRGDGLAAVDDLDRAADRGHASPWSGRP